MNKASHSPFESYCHFEDVADFFLNESFSYAYSAAEYEAAGIIFGKLIEKVDPPLEWKVPELPDSLSDWLKVGSEIQIIPDETTIACKSLARRLFLCPSFKSKVEENP